MTDKPTSAAVGRCGAAFLELAFLAKPTGSRWLDLDMTMGQLKAMFVLTMKGPQSVGRLGKALDITEPAASQLVDKLAERALVARESDPSDRRRTLVVPSPKGRDLVAGLQHLQKDRLTSWLDRLKDDDLHALLLGLEALLGVAQAEGGPDVMERSNE
jgi:DNA-binding MarR family transcriptional regulator